MTKLAVILFNMGGPDKLESVEPFLFNLFNDPDIIHAPKFFRYFIAKYISRKRAPIAEKIYKEIGGKSPLLNSTIEQAKALEVLLSRKQEVRVFVAMRYWRPMTDETVVDVIAFAPDEIVLLPLYPQFSTATSGSSLKEWKRVASIAGIHAPTYAICCYPDEPGFIEAQKKLILKNLVEASRFGKPRVLFSAHGLPEKTVLRGDPYSKQVEQTVRSLVAVLGVSDLDFEICYQSRVGKMEWIKPYIKDEITRAAEDGVSLVVVPIAFVSEHSETLVELDIDYRNMAMKLGVPAYFRAPTVSASEDFIEGLANLVEMAKYKKSPIISMNGNRLCSQKYELCPNK